MLDDRELVGVVLEIEKRYRKLVTYEEEEIRRARRVLGEGERQVRRNLYRSGWVA